MARLARAERWIPAFAGMTRGGYRRATTEINNGLLPDIIA